MEKKERFKNIEFLRFLLAIVIIFFHIFFPHKECFGGIFPNLDIVKHFSKTTLHAHLVVDMFFIISGFFMFYTFKNISVKDFFLKKIVRLYPLMCFFVLLQTTFKIMLYKTQNYLPYEQITKLLMINSIGFNTTHQGVIWFVPVLFWVLILYFYLVKYFDKKYINLLIPLMVIFSYSFLIHTTNGNIAGNMQTWYYVFNAGVLRGIAGVGVGYLIYEFYKQLKEQKLRKNKIFLYTFFESILLFFVFNNLIFHKLNYYSNFIIILAFIALFILFIIKRGYISRIMDVNFGNFLGRYAFSIYIVHMFILDLFKINLWKVYPDFVIQFPTFNVISIFVCSIILGVLTYHFIEQPAAKYLNKLWFNKENKNTTNSVGGGA